MTVFVRVVDCGSLSTAGRELRLVKAVVSSRIARLEKRLGVRLLNRTTRSVAPTPEGRVYYQHCQRILAEMREAELALASLKKGATGAIRVSVPITLGRLFVAPLVPAFIAANPDAQVRLQVTDRVVDLIEEDVDLAVRKGAPQPSSLIMRRLAPDLRVVAGARAYFEKHGVPATPEDLKAHNCLLLRYPGSHRFFWRFQRGREEPFNLHVAGVMDSDSSDVLIDWALAGHGLVMKSVWDLAPHLESGALVGVLADWWPRDLALSALMPPRSPQPPIVRALLEFLVHELKAAPPVEFTDPRRVPRP